MLCNVNISTDMHGIAGRTLATSSTSLFEQKLFVGQVLGDMSMCLQCTGALNKSQQMRKVLLRMWYGNHLALCS